MDRELSQQYMLLADAIEATGVGTWRWNVLTGETVFNERWAGILGYTLEELSPVSVQTWLNLAHPDDLINADDLLHKHFNGTLGFYDCEYRMRHKNGSWVWVHDRGRVVAWKAEHKPQVMTGINTDITARKQSEKEMDMMKLRLASTEKLASLGEMSMGLAHEINQPLGGIALVAASLRKFMQKNVLTPDRLEEGIKDIETCVQRMTRTVQHIRLFARQESLAFERVDPAATIDAVLSFLCEQLTIHKVELVKMLDPALPVVLGNPYQLEQVWISLISNAHDAMDEKEALLKEGAAADYHKRLVISASYQRGSGRVLITFDDNGIGMTHEHCQKAREPFFTTKEEGKGTGLGLSISDKIIEKHGGILEIESRPGEGSVFKIYLPVIGMEQAPKDLNDPRC